MRSVADPRLIKPSGVEICLLGQSDEAALFAMLVSGKSASAAAFL